MASKSKVKKSKRKKRQEEFEENLFESDDTFAFIVGYTSGGAPYGVTWEEMEEIERKEHEELEKRKTIQCVDDIDLPFY